VPRIGDKLEIDGEHWVLRAVVWDDPNDRASTARLHIEPSDPEPE
jgi:hypothetical protein